MVHALSDGSSGFGTLTIFRSGFDHLGTTEPGPHPVPTFCGARIVIFCTKDRQIKRSAKRWAPVQCVSIVPVDDIADFDDVFREHYGRLVRVLSAVGPGAEDAVAEAFSLALVRWRRVGRYDDPVAWVRRAAVHRMLNERRRLRRRAAALPRMVDVAPRGPDDVVPELAAAIRRLPRQQRIALVLRVLADLDTNEVAESMGISAGAVRYHLHEARHRLRAELGATDDA